MMIRAVALFIRWRLCLFMHGVGVPSTCLPQDVSRSGVKPRTRVRSIRQWRRRRQNNAMHTKLAAPMAEWCDSHLAEAKMKTIWEDFCKRYWFWYLAWSCDSVITPGCSSGKYWTNEVIKSIKTSWIFLKQRKYGEGPDFSCKYTPAVRAVVGRVSDGVRTTVRTDRD